MSLSSSERPSAASYAGIAAIAAFFAVFLFFPLYYVFKKSFVVGGEFSFTFFRQLFENPIITESVVNSLVIATSVTLISTGLGLFFATLIMKTDMPLKGLWGNLLLVPLVLPPFVGAIGVKYIFGKFGMVNSILMQLHVIEPRSPIDWLGQPFWGVVILETIHLFPIMYLNVVGAYSLIDPSIEEAARGLGARGWSLLRSVTMPLLMPGFFAGSSIVFIWAFTDLGTPLLFEYRAVAPVQIFNNVQAAEVNPIGYALVVVVLAVTVVFFLTSKFVFGRRRFEMSAFGRTTGQLTRLPLPLKIIALIFTSAFVLLSLIPHVSVALVSVAGDWFMTALPSEWTTEYYGMVFSRHTSMTSINNSLALSGVSVILVLIIGGAIAYFLARKRFRGREALDACAMLPLAVPGVVLAFGYVQCFFDTSLDPRVNPVPLLIVSYAVRRLPLVVRALYAGFQQAGVTLEEASSSLGASQISTLRRVTFPLIQANFVGASILAFAFSMLEVSDSLILAMQEKFYPMTKAIYVLMASRLGDGGSVASAMGVLGILLLAASIMLVQRLIGSRMGDLFRA